MKATTTFHPFFSAAPIRFGEFDWSGSRIEQRQTVLRWDVTAERIEVALALPGYTTDDIEITLNDKILVIKATRETAEELNFLRQERSTVDFERSIGLPYRIEGDAVEATYVDGVLALTLPRIAAEKPRQITINAR